MREILTENSLRRLSDLPVGECETFLIYGANGTGKTALCGTAGDRALFINIGQGIKTLQSPWFKSKYGYNPIVVSINEEFDAHGIFKTATLYDRICDAIDDGITNFSDQFDYIIIDDASALNMAAMHKGLEFNKSSRKSQTLDEIRRLGIMFAAVQDYQAEMNLVEQFIIGTINLCKQHNKHFVLTAHTRETFVKGDKIGELPKLHSIRPGFTGQTFPDSIPAEFDNVFFMECVGGGSNRVYRATTEGHEKLIAKSRWGGVFKTTEPNPNLQELVKRIKKTGESVNAAL